MWAAHGGTYRPNVFSIGGEAAQFRGNVRQRVASLRFAARPFSVLAPARACSAEHQTETNEPGEDTTLGAAGDAAPAAGELAGEPMPERLRRALVRMPMPM